VIILNPVFEIFHPEYHVAYRRFYDEVLAATKDPFEMQATFQEKFATDPTLVGCYRTASPTTASIRSRCGTGRPIRSSTCPG